MAGQVLAGGDAGILLEDLQAASQSDAADNVLLV